MFDYDTWLTTIPEYDPAEDNDENLLDPYDSWVDGRLVEQERYYQGCYAAAIEELGLLLIEKEDTIHRLTMKNQQLEKEIWNMKYTKSRKWL